MASERRGIVPLMPPPAAWIENSVLRSEDDMFRSLDRPDPEQVPIQFAGNVFGWLACGPAVCQEGKAETRTRTVLELASASGHAPQPLPTGPSPPPSPAQALQPWTVADETDLLCAAVDITGAREMSARRLEMMASQSGGSSHADHQQKLCYAAAVLDNFSRQLELEGGVQEVGTPEVIALMRRSGFDSDFIVDIIAELTTETTDALSVQSAAMQTHDDPTTPSSGATQDLPLLALADAVHKQPGREKQEKKNSGTSMLSCRLSCLAADSDHANWGQLQDAAAECCEDDGLEWLSASRPAAAGERVCQHAKPPRAASTDDSHGLEPAARSPDPEPKASAGASMAAERHAMRDEFKRGLCSHILPFASPPAVSTPPAALPPALCRGAVLTVPREVMTLVEELIETLELVAEDELEQAAQAAQAAQVQAQVQADAAHKHAADALFFARTALSSIAEAEAEEDADPSRSLRVTAAWT